MNETVTAKTFEIHRSLQALAKRSAVTLCFARVMHKCLAGSFAHPTCLAFLIFLIARVVEAQSLPLQVAQVTSPGLWQRAEFRLLNVPAAANPFDPDLIRVDATFTLPSGGSVTVPAFWYQGYSRALVNGREVLSASGLPEWRLRFAPPETGVYLLSVSVRTNGQSWGAPAMTNFTVLSGAAPGRSGYVRLDAGKQYFETGDGQALRLIGENVCWFGARGTYDYDDWFPAMQAAEENYVRLWMCPWAFGLETDANSLTHYRLDHAWDLDYVLQLAEQRGIFLELCLDYHGMFEVTPDYWGGNNYWPSNPYCITNGGPCLNQDGFFTNSLAKTIYQKRLRYLIGRYGYSPNLAAWQFFNEIDNVYSYLVPNDVAAWHGVMGGWLHTNDPFDHLVTTSLTGSSDRPEIWSLPQLDFANYHSYAEPGPATRLSGLAQSFRQRYGKPVLIDEFGTDWRGWNRTNDPYLRGLRQGLWGGALGGSVGTAMSWWWENIHSENDYPIYSALATVLNRTGWGIGGWTNIGFLTAGPPPVTVGDAIPGGQPFAVTLVPGTGWGAKPLGQLAVADASAADRAAATLNAFFQGTTHSDLRVPFRLSAWFTNNARLVMHLNSVSDGSVLVVRANGVLLYSTNLPNLDGTYSVNNEYNLDLPVNLPAGKQLIDISNAGADWFYLDWVRLEQVLPATYTNNWQPLPDAVGLRGPRESLLYVVAPGAAFPAGATNASLPLQSGRTMTLTNWPAGAYYAEWYQPATAARAGYTRGTAAGGNLALPLPDFYDDLAGILYPPPKLIAVGHDAVGGFQFRFDSETGGEYLIQKSTNLSSWTTFLTVTNAQGTMLLGDPAATNSSRAFFRAQQNR